MISLRALNAYSCGLILSPARWTDITNRIISTSHCTPTFGTILAVCVLKMVFSIERYRFSSSGRAIITDILTNLSGSPCLSCTRWWIIMLAVRSSSILPVIVACDNLPICWGVVDSISMRCYLILIISTSVGTAPRVPIRSPISMPMGPRTSP